jgi:glucans biosynthesis protein
VDLANAARRRLRTETGREHRFRDRSGDANAVIEAKNIVRNPATNGWRLFLRVKRQDDKKSTEMRANLRRGDATSETWSYVLPPE